MTIQHLRWNGMLVQIGFELFKLGNTAVTSLASIALFQEVLKISGWGFIADHLPISSSENIRE